MNYLAGPLTRTQIPALNQLVGARLLRPGSQPTAPPLDQYQAVPLTPASDTQPVPVTPAPTAAKTCCCPGIPGLCHPPGSPHRDRRVLPAQ